MLAKIRSKEKGSNNDEYSLKNENLELNEKFTINLVKGAVYSCAFVNL